MKILLVCCIFCALALIVSTSPTSDIKANKDNIDALLKKFSNSQYDTSEDDDDLSKIQNVFDILHQIEQEQAREMQYATSEKIPSLVKREFENMAKKLVGNAVVKVGKRYLQRRYCIQEQAQLQEEDDNDTKRSNKETFAELQSLLSAMRKLERKTRRYTTTNEKRMLSNIKNQITSKVKRIVVRNFC